MAPTPDPPVAASVADESTPLVRDRSRPNTTVVVNVCISALAGMLLGYDIGLVSGVIEPVKLHFRLDETEVELFVGALNTAALLGCVSSSFFADKYGRRGTLAAAGALFFLGNLLTALAWSYAVLLIGRCLAGLGMGVTLVVGPLYTAEVSPAHWRGMMTTGLEVSICIGLVLGCFANWHLEREDHVDEHWRTVVALGCLPSIGMFLGAILVMVESPRWLAMQGKMGEAEDVLRQLLDATEADRALADLSPTTLQSVQMQQKSVSDLLGDAKLRWTLMLGCMVAFMSQATGIEAIQYYGITMMEDTGFKRTSALSLLLVAAVVKLVFVFVGGALVDSYGRKPLLIASSLGIALSMGSMAIGMWTGYATLQILSMLLFYVFFSIGYGPVLYIVSAEIWPQAYRSLGSSIGLGVARVTSAIVALTYLSMSQALSPAGTAVFFASMALLGAVFIAAYLPETKGITLESTSKLLS